MLQQVKQLPVSEHDQLFIEAIEKQAEQKHMTLGVFGSFSVGKSALINVLVGQQGLLPTHTNETTAIPTYIHGGEKNRIVEHHFNGTEKELNNIKFHSLTAGGAVNEIERIIIERNTPSWLKEITLIDTPGRNTKFQAHIDASEQAIITSDAALYVMPWQGLTLEDIVYLKHILRYQPNLYFVINKVDRIDEAQGISIENMQERVGAELKEQFGKEFPVFAVSAMTGYNIDKLYVEFILPLKDQIVELKTRRLNYALEQFLLREKERVLQELALYEQALNADGSDFTNQKQELQIQYEHAQIDLTTQMTAMRDTMDKTEMEMKQYVQKCYKQLEVKLQNIAKINLSIDELTLKVENEIVTIRNEVFEALHGRIQKIVGDENAITLTSFDEGNIKFNMSIPNLAVLQEQYEQTREKTFAKIEAARIQLDLLPEVGNETKRDGLENEIAALTEQAMEKFVPEYIYDESFDANKGEKIASAIGFVGDMALTIALAAATAGASAAAQVGGKVAAKEVAKTAAKTAAKKAAAEVAEKTLIKGLTVATDTGGGTSPLLKAAKALDQFTSPVQTVAKKIGQQIDSGRSQPKREDLKKRQQFFARKLDIETERDNKFHQLEALEEQALTNERIRKELTLKREQVEKTMTQKLEQLQEQYEKETERVQQEHMQKEIRVQLEQILTEEEQYLNLWFKNEMATLINAVEQLLPHQLKEQLQQWEEQIADVEQLKTNDLSKIQQLIKEHRAYINKLDSVIHSE